MTTLLKEVQKEIVALHEFFVDWFSGECEQNDQIFQQRFSIRFSESFLLIPPAGQIVSLSQLSKTIKNAHGVNSDFRIAIRNVTIRQQKENWILATYEEWQKNAVNSTPPDNGRVSSVLFQQTNPNTLHWLHVHETWLPQEIMQAGPYNF